MDYPYEHGTAHYQLWKPPGNYFTRGEAPPPYEEAISLAQAESIGACTVSVATSTQRQHPLGRTETEAPQAINTNTTNLINININNGGNLTTIATGENHVLSSEPTDPQIEQVDSTLNSNGSNMNPNIDEACASFTSNYYTIPLVASEVCTNQNCNANVGSTCSYLMSHVPNVIHNTSIIGSSTIPKKRTSENGVENIVNINNQTVMPSPVFESITSESTTASEKPVSVTKYRTFGKRYHRTIPRQFAAVDPIVNPLKSNRDNIMPSVQSNIASDAKSKPERLDKAYNGNKRSYCQCPVQHTPMTYLSSHSVGARPNEASNETEKAQTPMAKKCISSNAIRHVGSHRAASVQTKPVQASFNHCKGGTLRKKYDNEDNSDNSVYFNHNFNKMQIFRTNDKLMVDDQLRVERQPNAQRQNSLPKNATLHDTNNSLKLVQINDSEQCEQNQMSINTSMHIPKILKQPSASTDREVFTKTVRSLDTEQNPKLPPKMYKHNNSRMAGAQHKSYYCNSKTHAISKASLDGTKLSIPDSNATSSFLNDYKLQKNMCYKSLPRNAISASHEYAQASRNTTQLNNTSQNINSSFSTLPKKTNKLGTRSLNLLTEVVNKIPSVINIPAPVIPPQHSIASTTAAASADSVPLQVTSIISNNRKSDQSTSRASQNPDQAFKSFGHLNTNEHCMKHEKPLPVLSTYTNCANPKEHFLPNDNSLDDDYLSECENCKSAHGSRYYLDEEDDDAPQETMTLQRKMPENEETDQQNYYRVSCTLPTNTNKKTPSSKNRETWFTTIPASSSSDEEELVE